VPGAPILRTPGAARNLPALPDDAAAKRPPRDPRGRLPSPARAAIETNPDAEWHCREGEAAMTEPIPHSNRVSGDCGLRCRETGFPGQRKKRQNAAWPTDQGVSETKRSYKTPPIRGPFVRDLETSVRIGVRGGAGRIRTSNQLVMNYPRLSCSAAPIL
jgi:hypothetical protein